MSRTLYLAAESDTAALGAVIAASLRAGDVIHLHGDLGAGKTTLARALIQALQPDARVKSPTYTLLESYELPDFGLSHLDLYRISDPAELEYLGLRELAGDSVLVVEWPERGGASLPPPDLVIHLELAGDGRMANVEKWSTNGERLLAAIP